MYLISVYFDDKTNKVLQGHIDAVAKATEQSFMLDNQVPPHITVGAFETLDERLAREIFDNVVARLKCGNLQFVSVGSFLPSVLYVTPVLNEYLQELSVKVHAELLKDPRIRIDEHYKPYSWFPHVTLGKKLTEEQLRIAFSIMQKRFSILKSEVVKIGLARTNPFCNLKEVELFSGVL